MQTNFQTWMTMKEVIAALEVSRRTVLFMATEGKIRRRETSSHHRYLRADVERLAAAQQAQTA